MSRKQLTWFGFASVAALMATAAAGMEPHKAVTPDAIKWEAAPPALPSGAQAAVLYGDPSKEGVFAMRLKMPKGYQIPPHTHPRPEIVTIISGESLLGMGEKADRKDVQRLPAGSFVAVSPGMAHYAIAEQESVVQLNSVGPWEIKYVNPADDPRKKTQ
jgi:quercetin dioxygenase-like cupin family protein